MQVRYQVNPQVLHETIAEEVVIVDLASGSYFSLTETGAEVWSWLEQGKTLAELSDRLLQKYDATQETVVLALQQFLTDLEAEKLVMAATVDEPLTSTSSGQSEMPSEAEAKAVFAAPALSKYTDMQELLLADPIHDVDVEAGWPNLSKADAA